MIKRCAVFTSYFVIRGDELQCVLRLSQQDSFHTNVRGTLGAGHCKENIIERTDSLQSLLQK